MVRTEALQSGLESQTPALRRCSRARGHLCPVGVLVAVCDTRAFVAGSWCLERKR